MLIEDTIFTMYCTSPPIRHFTWTTSKQLKGLPVAVCRAKALTFTVFVSYFKTPSIASPGNWTCNIRLCSYVLYMYMYNYIACTADKTELLLSLSAKRFQNPRPGPPAVYRDSSMHHDWPVKKKPLLICQSVWKKIRNAFLVFRWVCWGHKTRMLALLVALGY